MSSYYYLRLSLDEIEKYVLKSQVKTHWNIQYIECGSHYPADTKIPKKIKEKRLHMKH